MLELTIRLIVSLAIVIGLLLLLARFGARKFRGGNGALVQVVHRQALSRTSSVSVVTVGTRVLVLGTTEQQISVLAELDPDEIELDEVELADVINLSAPVGEDDLVAALAPPPPEPTQRTRVPGSHRAAPTARTGKAAKPSPAVGTGPLAGSVLSPQTWKQAFNAARRAS